MPAPLPVLPGVVVHCDWSKSHKKRWLACARLGADGVYTASGPELVPPPGELIPRLRDWPSASAGVLVGFDFPIGLPQGYAHRLGITDSLGLLPLLGREEPWDRFYDLAATAHEISFWRPFYPHGTSGVKQRYLLDALRANTLDDLRRQCERGHSGMPPACPLFWTLGPKQVGRAAINGWREVLAPALQRDASEVAVWPFSGELSELIRPGKVVLAETYPAEYYRPLGVVFGPGTGGKGSREARRSNGPALLAAAEQTGTRLSVRLQAAIGAGFDKTAGNDDGFDAVVGLLAMLQVVHGQLPACAPGGDAVRRIEGWILGQGCGG